MLEHVTLHGYLEVARGPQSVPGSVAIDLPPHVCHEGGARVLLSAAQAWHLVARLIITLEGTDHLSTEQCALLERLFQPEREDVP